MEHSQRRIRLAWYFYDWANSAFVTSVITVFLGPYLTSVAHASAQISGGLFIFGVYIYPESLFSYIVSLSVFLQVLILPFLGSIADLRNLKRKLLYLFAYLGSLFTISLYFLNEKTIAYGVIAFIIANIFFGASIVMYNSLLIEIASPNDRDKVSSLGWAFGYVGGGIVLGLNLITIFFSSKFGITNEEAIRISFAVAGVWWLLFSFISQNLFKLPLARIENGFSNKTRDAIKQLKDTLKTLFKNKNALIFFIAFLLFNDGVQTVIIISSQFGRRELNLSIEFLVLVILAVQFLSFLGTLIVMKINEIKSGMSNVAV
ncbi:MAG: MFS transporter, partial [Candidatus Kapaibacteriota bacterium]